MSAIREKLQRDHTEYRKSRNEFETRTLGMVLSDMETKERGFNGQPPIDLSTDQAVSTFLSKEVSGRRSTAGKYDEGGRPEAADNERREADLIASYLPVALSDDELARLADEVVSDLKPQSKRDMGKVITEVKARATGLVDGKKLSELVAARIA